VPKEVLDLINTGCLEAGFHIELGEKGAAREPQLVVDHQEEYVHYYRDNIYCVGTTINQSQKTFFFF